MDISPLSLSSPQLPPPPSSGTPFVPSIPLLLTENAPPLTQKKIAKLLSLQESMDWLRESFTANNGDLASWIEAHSSSSDPQRQSICFLLKTPELRQALVAHPFDFLLSIASFLEKQETQEAKQMLYQEIQRILQETTHSHELLSTAFPLLEGKSNSVSYTSLRIFSLFPKDPPSLLKQNLIALIDMTPSPKRFSLSEAVYYSSHLGSDLASTIDLICSYFLTVQKNGPESFSLFSPLLIALSKLPQEERTRPSLHALFTLFCSSNEQSLKQLKEAYKHFPPDQLNLRSITGLFHYLCQNKPSIAPLFPSFLHSPFDLIKKIDANKRGLFFACVSPFLEGNFTVEEKKRILERLENNGLWETIGPALTPFLQKKGTSEQRLHLLETIKKTPKTRQDQLLQMTLNALGQEGDLTYDSFFLEALQQIPLDALEPPIINLVKKLVIMSAASNQNTCIFSEPLLIYVFLESSDAQKNEHLINLFPLLQSLPSDLIRAQVFRSFLKASSGQKQAFLQTTQDLLQRNHSQEAQLLALLLSEEELDCAELLPKITDLLFLFDTLITIPQSLKQETFTLARLWVEEGLSQEDLSFLLPIFSVIPPEQRAIIFEDLCKNPPTDWASNIFSSLCEDDPSLKEASYHYVKNQLSASSSDLLQTIEWSSFLLNYNPSLLHWDENSSLVQEAESLSTLTSKDSLLEPKNPYRFYQTLRSSLLKDPLLPEPEYFPFRFSTLRAKAHPVFSLNDLPQGSNSHGFTSLFHQLETRLQGPYMESLQAQIKDRYGYSVETLSFNLLQGDLVQKLLQLKDPISSTTLQLYYILASIAQKTSDSSLELSPQEIALLDFAAAMSVCKVGQLDAIALFYSRLPSSEQTNNLTGQSPSLQVLTEFIHTSIQSALQDTFAKPALLTELSNDQEVKQAAHQTLYLKNRLFQQVGLVHTLTFDPHSHIIKDSLISNSLDCLLQAFVKHFPLNALLEKFKNAFSNQPLYMTVREILEKISTEKQLQERMSYHEDTFAITLSLEAVLALLQELNYLKPSS